MKQRAVKIFHRLTRRLGVAGFFIYENVHLKKHLHLASDQFQQMLDASVVTNPELVEAVE